MDKQLHLASEIWSFEASGEFVSSWWWWSVEGDGGWKFAWTVKCDQVTFASPASIVGHYCYSTLHTFFAGSWNHRLHMYVHAQKTTNQATGTPGGNDCNQPQISFTRERLAARTSSKYSTVHTEHLVKWKMKALGWKPLAAAVPFCFRWGCVYSTIFLDLWTMRPWSWPEIVAKRY